MRKAGQAIFRQSATYRQILAESPDVAQSMLNQFDNPRAEATVITLERIQNDAPCTSLQQLADIRVPTLVLANRQDPVHPFEYGQIIAAGHSRGRVRRTDRQVGKRRATSAGCADASGTVPQPNISSESTAGEAVARGIRPDFRTL